ncbi:MAG: RdgB/HAM1 family non-canonical purine NTP pyrophosphatase [Firmicutes bacterium]|nr:RdgB/HAM1 family non-canonical purine NTP pyrophosphatase [Bacillota bacterium]
MSAEVILASHNRGKLREFQQLLAEAPFRLTLWPGSDEIVEETGATYLENARLKAHFVARKTGCAALADDSGIEVDALQGLPGVHSARFVSSDAWENTREILLRLMSQPLSQRTARMRAVVCLAWPDGREVWAEGLLEGVVLGWPRGFGGFGVDPVFSVDGVHALAELSPEEKNQISHRARAVKELLRKLFESK